MTILSPAPDRLVSVSTPLAKEAELHNMVMEGGIAKMRPLAGGIELPAGQPVTLKPGGMHIMLMGLAEPLRPGDSFPMTLSFEKAGERDVTVTIEKPGAMAPRGNSAGSAAPVGR